MSRARYHRVVVRKLLAWIVVTLGIAALVRKLKRGGGPAEVEGAADAADQDPADELRRKLADSRGDAAPAAAEPGADETAEPTVEERRHEVHDQGRAALEEMQRSSED